MMSRGEKRQPRRRTALEPEKTPYEILEIPETASMAEIRKAYLKMVRRHPPEREPGAFKEIRTAYGRLKDSAERQKLDLSLFKTESDLGNNNMQVDFDFSALYLERIFQVLLASSDLYIREFNHGFRDMDKTVGGTK